MPRTMRRARSPQSDASPSTLPVARRAARIALPSAGPTRSVALSAVGVCVVLVALAACSSTQQRAKPSRIEAPAGATPNAAQLAEALATLRRSPCFELGRLGVVVLEPRDGRVLAQLNPRMGFMTASNMKLISSAVALQVLGPEFRYKTRLVGRGKRNGSSFDGDLILVGSGDPTFGAQKFEKTGCTAPFVRMARKLRELGLVEISGRILGDDAVHPDEVMGRGWDWSYHADWYAAQVGGLCFNENCVDFIFDGTSPGKAPKLRLEPPTRYVEVENRLRCVSANRSNVVFARTLGGNRITLTGTFAAKSRGKRDWGSVHNPTAYAATVLRETLIANGISVGGTAGDLDEPAANPRASSRASGSTGGGSRGSDHEASSATGAPVPAIAHRVRIAPGSADRGAHVENGSADSRIRVRDARIVDRRSERARSSGVERWVELHVERSAPMADILEQLNKRSQNLYAEQVVRTAAKAKGGDGGFQSAQKTALAVLAELGVETKGLRMADASGLTRLNLVQPLQIAQLLRGMLGSEHAELYLGTLPIAGVDGTLRRRFSGCEHAKGRVRAKTGYISRVVALSGYVPRKGADPLVFSILVNDFVASTNDVKRAVDRFVDELARLCGPRP